MPTTIIKQKTENAYRSLLHYSKPSTETEDVDVNMQSLLVDLRHLADEYGVDFDELIQNSLNTYNQDKPLP